MNYSMQIRTVNGIVMVPEWYPYILDDLYDDDDFLLIRRVIEYNRAVKLYNNARFSQKLIHIHESYGDMHSRNFNKVLDQLKIRR